MTADKDESLSPLYNTEEHSDEDEEEKLLIFHPEKEYQGSNKLYRKVYNYFNDFSELIFFNDKRLVHHHK